MAKRGSGGAFRWVLIFAILCLAAALMAGAEETDALYVENEWNFVDGSIDVSSGIPEDATGVLARVRASGRLRVATEPYFPPQEFIDPALMGQERFVGADMDLARRIAERMGVELEIVPMQFSKVLPSVAEGECDLAISGLSFTPGRAQMVEFSKGYHFYEESGGTGLLVREADLSSIAGVDDLSGRNIVAQSGSVQEALMAEKVLYYHEFRRVSSIEQAYEAVENGAADAAAVDIETARLYIEGKPECGLALVPGVRFALEAEMAGDRLAGRKGELQLMFFVNGVIDEVLESGEYARWFDAHSVRANELGL